MAASHNVSQVSRDSELRRMVMNHVERDGLWRARGGYIFREGLKRKLGRIPDDESRCNFLK